MYKEEDDRGADIAPNTRLNDDEFITLDEAADRIFGGHVTAWTLKAEIRRGNLKAFKLGRRYFTTPAHARELAQCLAVENRPASTLTSNADNGSSSTQDIGAAQAALSKTLQALKQNSGITSLRSINRKRVRTR